MHNTDIVLYLIGGILAVVILLGLLIGLGLFINDFSLELKYINSEIQQATGDERKYWIHRKRRLWLSLLPFVKY